jgi:hypothetical protein
VIYLTLIHRALSGRAANDPDFDVDVPLKSVLERGRTAKVPGDLSHSTGNPSHA